MPTEQARKCATELVASEEPTLDISALIEHRAEIIARHFPDAGMIEKLRKALEKQGFHKLDDGSLCFCEHRNPASLHEEHAEHCQLARTALAESEPPQQPLWSDAPDLGPPAGSVQTDADTLKPTVTIPLQLSPPEIARRILDGWFCLSNTHKELIANAAFNANLKYSQIAADQRKRIAELEAVVQKERKAASEAKLSVTKYAGRRIAELEDQEKQYEARLEETAHSVSVWQRAFGDAGKRISELKAALKKSEDSQREYFELNERLQDDLKLQRQANKFGDDQHKQEVETLKRQLDFLRGLC